MNREVIDLSGRTISAQEFLRMRQAHEFIQDYVLYDGCHLGGLSDADSYVSESFGDFTLREVSSLVKVVELLEQICS